MGGMMPKVDPVMWDIRAKLVDACGDCRGVGYVRGQYSEVVACTCMKVLQYLNALVNAGIPRRYWHLSLDHLSVKSAFVKVTREYIQHLDTALDRALGIMFSGSTGIGKTTLACEIAKEAVVQGYPVRYLTVRQYIDSVFGRDPISTSNLKLVIIDEIDKVAVGNNGSEAVLQMVEDFLRANVPNRSVIACSNLDMDEMAEKFGAATTSLLGRALKLIPMEGSDYSEQAQEEWDDLLKSEYDYRQPAIVSMAERMYERVHAEEEA